MINTFASRDHRMVGFFSAEVGPGLLCSNFPLHSYMYAFEQGGHYIKQNKILVHIYVTKGGGTGGLGGL